MSKSSFREWNMDCKVYIGNLSEGASKSDVESSFGKYGPLRNVWVARNPPGFAFVEYEDPRDAEDAVRSLDGTKIAGSRVRVEMSHGRSRRGGFHGGAGGGGGGGGGGRHGGRPLPPPPRNGGDYSPYRERRRPDSRDRSFRHRDPPPPNSRSRSRSRSRTRSR